MKLVLLTPHRNCQNEGTWEEIIYGKKVKEPLVSKALRHAGYICAGGYIGSAIVGNIYHALIFLGLAWGSVGARHFLYERKE